MEVGISLGLGSPPLMPLSNGGTFQPQTGQSPWNSVPLCCHKNVKFFNSIFIRTSFIVLQQKLEKQYNNFLDFRV